MKIFNRFKYFEYLVLIIILTIATPTKANTLNCFKNICVDGKIRIYDFSRMYRNKNLLSQNAFAIGGQINFLSELFLPEWQVGASLYFTNPLGMNSKNYKKVDNTLPGINIISLGQSFLQYKNMGFLLRIGNQIIDTPWLNSADSRMIPMTFQGLYTSVNINNNISLIGLRTFKFKDKNTDEFTRTNLYNPNGIFRNGIAPFGQTTNQGVFALGLQNKFTYIQSQAWYYHFYDLANILYFDSKYQSNSSTEILPLFGMQLIHEWEDGRNLLNTYKLGKAKANGYGLLIGGKNENTEITLAYNYILRSKNYFHSGNILSPYTSGNDPLYTTSMISGLIEKAPGQAIKLSVSHQFLDKRVKTSFSFAKYYTKPLLANTNETDFDVIYTIPVKYSDISIRYRVGLLEGDKTTNKFMYNRIMLQINF